MNITKVAVYCRSSTTLQENSINMQLQLAFEKSIEHALPIDEEYIDEAVSARKITKNNRKRLNDLLREIEQDRIHTLFVYKRDRLARNSLEYLEIYELLKEKNVNVIFTNDSEIPLQFSPIGELIECVMAGMIQREGEQIVKRITETIKANFKNGTNKGPLPYGYLYQSKNFSKVPEEVDNITTIFEEILSKKYNSLTEIRKELERKGIKRKGKPFTNQFIKKVISDPTYMGLKKLNIDNEIIEKQFNDLTIIEEDKWIKAQQILQRIAPDKNLEPIPDQDYLLEDKLKCSLCDQILIGKGSRVQGQFIFKYQCSKHKNIYVEKEEVEEKVLHKSYEFFQKLTKTNLDSLFKRYISNSEKYNSQLISNIDNKIEAINSQLIHITERWFYEKRQDTKFKLENKMLALYQEIKDQKQMKDALLVSVK